MSHTLDAITDQFQALIDQGSLVGLALAIIRNGETIYSRGMGVTGVEDYRLPVTPDTLFAIGSITKTVAAATIMRLVEQQALDLDRPIVEYLAGFAFEDTLNGARVTLRHLLSHASGLPAAGRNWGLRGRDALRRFVDEDLRYHQFFTPPGTVHLYSNTAISCAGYVAEAVTGIPFDTLVQQLIFDPLGMDRSTFNLAEAMTYPTALPHRLDAEGMLRVIHRQADNDMGHASSFCFGSTHDLAKFAAALLTPGVLFDAATLRHMQSPAISLHVEGANYPGALMNAAFGLGQELGEYRGCRLVGHGGMNQSFNCFLKLFPDQQIALVLQTNYMGDEDALNIVFELFDELLQPSAPLRPPEPATVPDATQAQRVGEYINPARGIRTITLDNGQLMLDSQHALICIGEGQYVYRSDWLRFPVAFPYPDTLVVRGLPYTRLHREAFEPDLAQWQTYAGVFVDPFTPYPADSAIRVHFDQGRIWINDTVQEALSNTRFVSARGLYEFSGRGALQVQMGCHYVRSSQSDT
ncbi:MAG: hypothetical protein CL610_29460 [Anaerolineaceae bacterium]|nr:hypothetical protein [Anaerolineaceae bacterium]